VARARGRIQDAGPVNSLREELYLAVHVDKVRRRLLNARAPGEGILHSN
jgi:hypothetical protein